MNKYIFYLFFISSAYATCSCARGKRIEELGRHSWDLIHSISANYPENPDYYDKFTTYQFIQTIASYYPCTMCRNHFNQNLNKYGIHLNNRTDMSHWTCFLHNKVNEMKNKPFFDCESVIDKYTL